MNEEKWEYYGRDGASGYSALYRVLATPRTEPFTSFAEMEQYMPDGTWKFAGDQLGLKNDWASGWFDFESNRLSESEAMQLMSRLSTNNESK